MLAAEVQISKSGEFRRFRDGHLHKGVKVWGFEWSYLEVNPTAAHAPLILLPGTSGTAQYFFRVLALLESRGVRALAVTPPPTWTAAEFALQFTNFLDAIHVTSAHLLGVSLGGYLALHVAHAFPVRVSSLILCNAFSDTANFARSPLFIASLSVLPEFYLKSYLLAAFPSTSAHPEVLDFVVEQVDSLSGEEMAARLALNVTEDAVPALPPALAAEADKRVTLLESADSVVLPRSMRARLDAFCGPAARRVAIKEGADFPFLTRAGDIIDAVLIHLLQLGVTVAPAPRPRVVNGRQVVLFDDAAIDEAVADLVVTSAHKDARGSG